MAYRKISDETVETVRAMRRARSTIAEIAERTGLSHGTIIKLGGPKTPSEATYTRELGSRMAWEQLTPKAKDWLLRNMGKRTGAQLVAELVEIAARRYASAEAAADDPAGRGEQEGTGEGA